MEPIAKILCVSPDPVLLQTRRWILEGYFQVDCAGRLSEAAAMIESQSYDLILLCYSLTAEECRQVHKLVRARSPRSQILALTEGRDGCAEAYSNQQMPVAEGPYALLKKVAAMIAPETRIKIKRNSKHSRSAANKKLPVASAGDIKAIPSLRIKLV
jgi:CheY-like chemotaxis protein